MRDGEANANGSVSSSDESETEAQGTATTLLQTQRGVQSDSCGLVLFGGRSLLLSQTASKEVGSWVKRLERE